MDLKEDSEISIYNLAGQIIKKEVVKKGECVNIAGFENGIYFVVANTRENTISTKFIVVRD